VRSVIAEGGSRASLRQKSIGHIDSPQRPGRLPPDRWHPGGPEADTHTELIDQHVARRTCARRSSRCSGRTHDSGSRPTISSSKVPGVGASALGAPLVPAARRRLGRLGEMHPAPDRLEFLVHEPPSRRRLERNISSATLVAFGFKAQRKQRGTDRTEWQYSLTRKSMISVRRSCLKSPS
jgi:hypothetical protein